MTTYADFYCSNYGHDFFAGESDPSFESVGQFLFLSLSVCVYPKISNNKANAFPFALFLVRPAWGPLSRDVNSVVTVAKILLDGKAVNEIDPLMAPLPFNEQV